MTEPAITPELVQKHNLTPEEYEKVKEILGREPSYTELGIFSVMWSEHCSYKNTRPLLKTFPTKSPKILVGAGEENAGIIDIGDGLAIAFKIESHNHPERGRAVPGRGHRRRRHRARHLHHGRAAGLLGQFAAVWADHCETADESSDAVPPIANNRRLFGGVVAGIAHYGNCFGIPTIAGEVYFDKSYEGNPLVNAFCLGVLRHEQIARGAAKGVGNPVFYVGPATGRDGLAGAAFASQDLTEESAEQQRGAVQVGDPFMEKLVCEACLELLATGAVAGIQDMGAAGLTCSTCETAARAGTGIEIELDKVPQRAPNMTQLRDHAQRIAGAHADHRPQGPRGGSEAHLRQVGSALVGDRHGHRHRPHGGAGTTARSWPTFPPARSPTNRPSTSARRSEPAYLKEVGAFRLDGVPDTQDPAADLKALLSWPTIASKNWVYRQYDHMVRDGSVGLPGQRRGGAAHQGAIPLPGDSTAAAAIRTSEKFIAMSRGCNGALRLSRSLRRRQDRRGRGGAQSGLLRRGAAGRDGQSQLRQPAQPRAVLAAQGKRARPGRSAAAHSTRPSPAATARSTTRSPAGPIDPTPTVAMVGLIEKPEHITTQWFKDEGDAIILLGDTVDPADPLLGLGGSRLSAAHSRPEERHAAALRPGKGNRTAPGAARR